MTEPAPPLDVVPPPGAPPFAEPPFAEPPLVEPPFTEPPLAEPPLVEPPLVEPPLGEPLEFEAPPFAVAPELDAPAAGAPPSELRAPPAAEAPPAPFEEFELPEQARRSETALTMRTRMNISGCAELYNARRANTLEAEVFTFGQRVNTRFVIARW